MTRKTDIKDNSIPAKSLQRDKNKIRGETSLL